MFKNLKRYKGLGILVTITFAAKCTSLLGRPYVPAFYVATPLLTAINCHLRRLKIEPKFFGK